MTKMLRKLAGDRSGATAIEYGLIAAFIALAMVAVLPNINTKLHDTFQNVDDGLQSAADANAGG
jgi:pilus assembly protein Flp/PilA